MAYRRSLEPAALTAFVPVIVLAPFCLVALAIAWLPLAMITDIPYSWVAAAWIIGGLLLFFRPFQVAVLSPVLGARRPTLEEIAVIDPVWDVLTHSNGYSPQHFVLRVLPADELNAYACGGHLVIVTTFALEQLTEDELAGVLAHELSHHIGLHTVALTLGHWLSIPVLALARIGFFLQNVARAATDSFASDSVVLRAIGGLVAGLLRSVSWIFLAALLAADSLGNLFGHRSEYEADRRVVDMGYGRHLAGALRRVVTIAGTRRPEGWRERLAASHPPALTRVARIEALLRTAPRIAHP